MRQILAVLILPLLIACCTVARSSAKQKYHACVWRVMDDISLNHDQAAFLLRGCRTTYDMQTGAR